MRIYIESTIPGYIVNRPARDLLQAARQRLTQDWWNLASHRHRLYTSQLVRDEVGKGELEMARKRLELIVKVPSLESTEAAQELAREILASRLLPARADSDAAHIALATVHRIEVILTWNCRHIANPVIADRLRYLALKSGYALPTICTPMEISGELYA